jgi:AraC family transcriptional regulator of adaptative response/methylated-DNA-[protein]-cysteine methyltransferase
MVRTPAQRPMAREADPVGDDAAWRAVLDRDAGHDGRLVYAVRTTGVYCRPTCPSRRPRRSNVRFYASAAEAEADGFRACRRCRPRDDRPSAMARAVEAARRYLEAHWSEPVTLDRLARAVHTSPFHLHRTFRRRLGVTPREYLQSVRARMARAALRSAPSVGRAVHEAGYGSPSRLYESAGARLGMTPGAYRRGGAGESIRYATVSCSLGWLLVAATDRGVCAVSLGDAPADLDAALRAEFPRADVQRGDAALEGVVGAIRDALEAGGAFPDLPLDVRATTFQMRVWQALRGVPAGATVTYAELARRAGSPRAVRAVASACAANPVALLIPCHRVVRADGRPGGYRWGPDRKRLLLGREADPPG